MTVLVEEIFEQTEFLDKKKGMSFAIALRDNVDGIVECIASAKAAAEVAKKYMIEAYTDGYSDGYESGNNPGQLWFDIKKQEWLKENRITE